MARSSAVTGAVVLQPRNASALSATVRAITTKGSPDYHHYLPAGYFSHFFGPTPATVSLVESSLRGSGLRVTSVSANGLVLDFTTSAATAESTFGTTLERYRLADGRTAYAPSTAVTLPASIAGSVQTVVGLSDVLRPTPMAVPLASGTPIATRSGKASVTRSTAARGPGPVACSAATTDSKDNGDVTDQQLAESYGLDPLYGAGDTGAGQTVAIFDLGDPYAMSDVKTFDTCYFGAAKAASMLANITNIPVDGGTPTGSGVVESALDVEAVAGIAPSAKIDVYEAPDLLPGWLDEFNRMVSDDKANVVTASYGICEPDIPQLAPGLTAAENTVFEQAALQGQTVLASSGDDGSDSCAADVGGEGPEPPLLSTSDPASQPYVTAVGGTTVTAVGQPPDERVWNGAAFGASGGGISSVWRQPAWQRDSGVPGVDDPTQLAAAQHAESAAGETGDFCDDSAPAQCREVPDVAAIADGFTGLTIAYQGSVVGVGGTSVASPVWAGVLADINASASCSTTHGVGFVSPELYSVASVPAEYAASFNDVRKGNNDMFGSVGGVYAATKGYDMATGLGTPAVTRSGSGRAGWGLDHYLCAAAAATAPTVSGITPQAVPDTGATTVTVTGSGFESNGHSDIAGVTVGPAALPLSDYTVTSPTSLTVNNLTAAEVAGTGSPDNGDGTYDVTVTVVGGATSRVTAHSRLGIYKADASANAQPVIDAIGLQGGNEAGGTTTTVYGSGFTHASSVTFGGVAGTGLHIVNDSQLTVSSPAYQSGTTVCLNGEDPATDVCQTQLVVHTATGSSSTDVSSILPEAQLTADDSDDTDNADSTAPAATSEFYPAATEFDYLPTPTLTTLTLLSGYDQASEGGDEAAITGTGLGVLGLQWFNVGRPGTIDSQDYPDTDTATSISLPLPPIDPTTSSKPVQITAETLASPNWANVESATPLPSNPLTVTYAPTPVVTGITTDNRYHAGPASGGNAMTVRGSGFTDPTDYVQFLDDDFGPSFATQYDVTTNRAGTSLSLTTPGANPGVDDVSVCGISGCSDEVPSDLFTFFPTGNATVDSVSPRHGQAGAVVTVHGVDLGFVTAVYFGKTKAKHFANAPQILDSGNPYTVTAVAPAERVGSTVGIRVQTLEGLVNSLPPTAVNPHATFTFRRSTSTTTLQSSTRSPKAGRTVTFVAVTRTSTGSAPPGGRIAFVDNGKRFVVRHETKTGKVVVHRKLGKGTHTISAVYEGTAKLGRSKASVTLTAD